MPPLRVKQKTALRDAVLEKAKTNALVKRTIDMDVNWAKWPKEDLQYLAAVNSDPISTIEEQDTVPEPMFRGLANTVTGAAGAVVDYTSDLVNPGPDVPNANSFYGGIVGGVRGALGALTGIGASQAEAEFARAEEIDNEEIDGAAVEEADDIMYNPAYREPGLDERVAIDTAAREAMVDQMDPSGGQSGAGEFFKGVAGAITGVVSAVADAVVGPPSQSAETIARIQAEVDAEKEAERMAIQAEAAEATRLDRMAVREEQLRYARARIRDSIRYMAPEMSPYDFLRYKYEWMTDAEFDAALPDRYKKSVVQQAAELPAKAAAAVVDAVAPAPAKSVVDEVVKMPVEAASSVANAVVPPARSIQSTKSLAGLDYSRIGFESSTVPAVAKVAAKVTGTTTTSSLGPKTKVRLSKSAARAEAERIADAYYTGNPVGDKADRRRRAKRSTTSLVKYAENPAALDFRGSRSKR